jgi:dipeptidase E
MTQPHAALASEAELGAGSWVARLIPFQLNPHHLDPDPRSPHQGQTRPQPIEELLEESDVPVLGLREGAWLQVSGLRAHLSGCNTGRLFRRHTGPTDIPVSADLSYLLNTCPRFGIGATT